MDPIFSLEEVQSIVAIVFIFGIFLGIVLIVAMVYLFDIIMKKDFKRYIYSLPCKDQEALRLKLDLLEQHLEEIARQTNTRYFNIKYNSFVRLKTVMKQKNVQLF
jgi:hypothetical protein